MRIINDIQNLVFPRGLCATIGNFDGLHSGHRELIRYGQEIAKNMNLDFAVVTFWPHPRHILPNIKEHSNLTSRSGRHKLLADIGVPTLLEIPFSMSLANLSAEEFLRKWLLPLNLKYLIAGYDFSMGHDRKGDMNSLNELGEKHGFLIRQLPAVLSEDKPVSSSLLRRIITAGDVAKAAGLLGRRYTISGRVAHGFGRGTVLGFPTANLDCIQELLPGNGVYAAYAHTAGKKYEAVVNIGRNPTFNGDKITVESFLLDINANLYGQEMQLEFVERLRNEIKFPTPDKLIEQINIDIANAKKIFATAK